MGRAPCCAKVGLKTGRWTAEEDEILTKYIEEHGEGAWRSLPKNAGLLRCGKSCRLRWINYLRSDVKRGSFTKEEEDIIVNLRASIGNKWSLIASQLPGRTDNDIKNYWNSHLSRRIDTFRRPNREAYSLPIIINLKQIKEKTPPRTKSGTGRRTSTDRSTTKKKKRKVREKTSHNNVTEANDDVSFTARAGTNSETTPLHKPTTTTKEISLFVVNSKATDSRHSQGGVNEDLMECPVAGHDIDELGNQENDLLTELFMDQNDDHVDQFPAVLSQCNGNNNIIEVGGCCSNSSSSSTMATIFSGSHEADMMIGDWDWDWQHIVREIMDVDNHEVLTSLWESNKKDDSHCGGEIIDYEKHKADIVAWLFS